MDSAYERDGLELVKASPHDIKEIHAMWLEAADWMKSRGIDQWREDQLTVEIAEYCLATTELFVVKENGRAAGSFFIIDSDPHIWGDDDGGCGYLHRLVVRRAYAGRGLGFKLLDLAERHLRASGKKMFRLDCMADSPKLNEFYTRAGFTYRGRKDGNGWSASLYERSVAES
ncbi:hypothetical protein SD70_05815 [Gordoniibacillus kamchatkensis]|uniref:N-acetyltransferase domain-containing protein n=1 Tax=Gordoniibacillus kamchatkensis TaxID=1590651 RepID=A0ABR5AKT4_9BACL|nr:GNAT family N-acetyltransferase [Paenibacillus sp. VKM B-2647]KIL41638.1 hypothetical protein SD70_05815 [Paenibacillus sp. VKM B-2647]